VGRLLDALAHLDTSRLRPLVDGDVDWMVAAGDDADLARWNGIVSPLTRQAATDLVTRRLEEWETDSRATFAVVRAGVAGGYLSLRVAWPRGIGEVGYWLLRSHRGYGLMTAAVIDVRDWALDHLGLTRVQSGVQPGNHASQAVLHRAGFQREGLLRNWDRLSGVLHDEWMFSYVPDDRETSSTG